MEHKRRQMKNKIIKLLFISLIFISCKNECIVETGETLFTTVGKQGGEIKGYAHYIYLDGIEKTCLDSLYVDNLVNKYLDTVSVDKPADLLMFYSSKDNFTEGEKSYVQKKINQDCLIKVGLNNNTEIYKYWYYDSSGEFISSKANWDSDALKK